MIKTTTPDTHDALVNSGMPLTTFINPGERFKSASEVFLKAAIDKFAPPRGMWLQHLIAMGAHESYGCFFRHEPVRTRRGLVPIQDVQKDEEVLTHRGRWRPVTHTFARAYQGQVTEFSVSGIDAATRATEEHPFWVVDADKVQHKDLYNGTLEGEGKLSFRDKASTRFTAAAKAADFKLAKDLKVGDWVCIPGGAAAESEQLCDVEHAWALGLYAAEGCTAIEYRDIVSKGQVKEVVFTLGAHDDAAVIPRLIALIESHGNRAAVYPSYTSEEGRRVTWTNQKFSRLCALMVPGLANTKYLHPDIFTQSREWKLSFLAGWLDGDGHIAASGKSRGCIRGSSASRSLAADMQRLMGSVDIAASFSLCHNRQKNGCFGAQDFPIYALAASGSQVATLLPHCSRLSFEGDLPLSQCKIRVVAGDVWMRISKIRRFDSAEDEVYATCFNLEVEEDHSYVTLVAGHNCNRNGDAFERGHLKSSHDTFVKHAHLYREHRNTCPATLGIGEVKASAYNPKMDWVELLVWGDRNKAEKEYEMAKAGKELSYSMSCFPAGTPVRKGDGSHAPIETIQPGDEILTHKGRIQKVSHVMERDYSGPGVRLRAYGLPYDVPTTADHGIWARRRAKHIHTCPCCGGVFKKLKNHMKQGDAKHRAAAKDLARYAEGFTAAANLLPGDLIRQPVDKTVAPGNASTPLAIVAGYYAAEGSLSVIRQKYTSRVTGEVKTCPDHRVEFTFHIGETDYIAELQDAIEALGYPRPSTHDYPKENRTVVRSHSKSLHNWLREHCGKYSHLKVFSREVMTWEPEFQKVLLEKWIAGDGTFAPIGNGKLSGTTVSEAMAWQLVDLAARNELVAGMWTSPNEKHVARGRKRPYYVTLTGGSARGVGADKFPATHTVTVIKTCSTSHLRHQTETSTALHAVSQPLCFIENGFVYRRLRKVTHETLVAKVYDFTVPGDHGFTVAGMGVSNCKIAGDICSCCNHFARRTTDYCSHAANHMNQYLPEFQKYAFVFNPNPRFFDISIVGRPADRIAHYITYRFGDDMAKAASAGALVVGGAEWSQFYGQRDDDALTNWVAAMHKDAASIMETRHLTGIQGFGSGIQLSDRQLKKIASVNPGTVLRTMAKHASVLPFESFVAWFTGSPIGTITKDASYRAALDELHQGKLASECAQMCGLEGDLCGGAPGDEDIVDEVMDEMDGGLACKVQGGVKPITSSCEIKLATDSSRAWAAAYGVYKAAAIREMRGLGTLDEMGP